jgi:chromosomal replication initiation ATPase DnaA
MVAAAANRYGIPTSLLRGPSRESWLVDIRKEVARDMRAAGFSFPIIGAAFGGRHHSTVMYWLGLIPSKRRKRDVSDSDA